jgi:hypothetical protein
MSKLAFWAQTVDIAYLPLRQDFLAKNVLMTAQRDFRLGNSPSAFDPDAALRKTGKVPLHEKNLAIH